MTRTIPLAAYRRAHRDRLRPHLPSLATMVRMLRVPRVWAQLEPLQRLIVKKAERVAADEGADPLNVVLLTRPLGAMIDVHYCIHTLTYTVAPPADHAAPRVGPATR